MHSQVGHKNPLKATTVLRVSCYYEFAGMKGRRKGVKTFIYFDVKTLSTYNFGEQIQKILSKYKVSRTTEKVKQ